MDIEFKTNKLKRDCTEFDRTKKAYGQQRAVKIVQRLQEIQAAETLDVLSRVPGAGCHPLTGNRNGQFAVKLTGNYRLIFEPVGDDKRLRPEGILLCAKVTKVRIVKVEDYH